MYITQRNKVIIITPKKNTPNKGVCHTCKSFAIYIKNNNLKAKKKNYENSNISACKNIIFKKSPLKETKILPDIITLHNN
jgi:hypothetical protein